MAKKGARMAWSDSSPGFNFAKPLGWLAVLTMTLLARCVLKAQDESQPVDDMTGKYHFLSADDTLAILDED